VPHLQFVGKYVTGHKSWSFDNVSSTNSETIKVTRSNIKTDKATTKINTRNETLYDFKKADF